MQCPRCHAKNPEGRRFCGECGLSFASACPSCGFLNEAVVVALAICVLVTTHTR
jgi:predicted amidophosphoribosyltransferase